MLKLNEIAARIEQPSLCRPEDSASLLELCDKFPFAQLFPLLYLKSLAVSNDHRFDAELEKHAFKISDRVRLYQLIQEQGVTLVEETSKDDSPTIEPKEEHHLTTKEVQPLIVEGDSIKIVDVEEIIEDSLRKIESTEDPIISDIEEIIEEEVAKDKGLQTTSEVSYFDQHNQKEEQTEEDSFTKEMLAQSMSGAYQLAEEPAREEQEISYECFIQPEVDEVKESAFKEALEIDTKRSFTAWLRATEPSSQNQFIEESKEDETLFAEKNEKKEFFSPVKTAKESVDEHKMPVSETLAKVFAAQGNFPKAIYAYEQLMLIIPEKKVFFASQIEELKKKINT